MKFQIKDSIVLALTVLGIVSDFNFLDVPFWVYVLCGVAYFAMRLGWEVDDNIKK